MRKKLVVILLSIACLLCAFFGISCAKDKPTGEDPGPVIPSIPVDPFDPIDPIDPVDPTPPAIDPINPEPHTHTEVVIPGQPATCTASGWTDGTKCSECNAVLEPRQTIPQLQHTYSSSGTVVDATCEHQGYTLYECENCTATVKNNIIPTSKHTWVTSGAPIKDTEDENCGTATVCYTLVYSDACSECNEETSHVTYVSVHKFTVTIETPATCTTPGEKRYTCDCGYSYVEEYVDARAHTWPTGSGVLQCLNCSETKSVISGTTEAQVTKTELATQENVEVQFENNVSFALDNNTIAGLADGDVKLGAEVLDKTTLGLSSDELDAIGDNQVYDFSVTAGGNAVSNFDGLITVSLPCDPNVNLNELFVWYLKDDGTIAKVDAEYSNGNLVFTTDHFSRYTVVRLTAEQYCEKYNHTYVDVSYDATCEAYGFSGEICSVCGHEKETNHKVEMTGHNYVEGDTIAPRCDTNGYTIYRCINDGCNVSYNTNFEYATGHTYQTQQVLPTCSERGYTLITCEDCDYTDKQDFVGTIAHTFEDGICTECSAEELNSEYFYNNLLNSLFTDGITINVTNMQVDISVIERIIQTINTGRNEYENTETTSDSISALVKKATLAFTYTLEDGFLYEMYVEAEAMGETVKMSQVFKNGVMTMCLETNNHVEYMKADIANTSAGDAFSVVEGMFQMYYVLGGNKLMNFNEIMGSLAGLTSSDENGVSDYILTNFFTSEVVGEKTVYTFDGTKLTEFAENINTKSIKEIIEIYAGEDSYDTIINFVRDNGILTIQETLDVLADVGISEELVISLTKLANIDLSSFLDESVRDKTLAEVCEMILNTQSDGETTVDPIESLVSIIDEYAQLTLAEIIGEEYVGIIDGIATEFANVLTETPLVFTVDNADVETTSYEELVNEMVGKYISLFFTVREDSGDRYLNFNASYINSILNDVTTIKIDEFIDRYMGEGTYQTLLDDVTTLTEKTVDEYVDELNMELGVNIVDLLTIVNGMSEVLGVNSLVEQTSNICNIYNSVKDMPMISFIQGYAGNYLPIDFNNPVESISQMFENCTILEFFNMSEESFSLVKDSITSICDAISLEMHTSAYGTLKDISITFNNVQSEQTITTSRDNNHDSIVDGDIGVGGPVIDGDIVDIPTTEGGIIVDGNLSGGDVSVDRAMSSSMVEIDEVSEQTVNISMNGVINIFNKGEIEGASTKNPIVEKYFTTNGTYVFSNRYGDEVTVGVDEGEIINITAKRKSSLHTSDYSRLDSYYGMYDETVIYTAKDIIEFSIVQDCVSTLTLSITANWEYTLSGETKVLNNSYTDFYLDTVNKVIDLEHESHVFANRVTTTTTKCTDAVRDFDDGTYLKQEVQTCKRCGYTEIIYSNYVSKNSYYFYNGYHNNCTVVEKGYSTEGANSCEDGYYVVIKCGDCDQHFILQSNRHALPSFSDNLYNYSNSVIGYFAGTKTEITIPFENTCDGFGIERYTCFCGENNALFINNGSCDLNISQIYSSNIVWDIEGVSRPDNMSNLRFYSCAVSDPDCDVMYVVSKRYNESSVYDEVQKDENCEAYGINYIYYAKREGDSIILFARDILNKSYLGILHDNQANNTTVVNPDNSVTITDTMVCGDCGKPVQSSINVISYYDNERTLIKSEERTITYYYDDGSSNKTYSEHSYEYHDNRVDNITRFEVNRYYFDGEEKVLEYHFLETRTFVNDKVTAEAIVEETYSDQIISNERSITYVYEGEEIVSSKLIAKQMYGEYEECYAEFDTVGEFAKTLYNGGDVYYEILRECAEPYMAQFVNSCVFRWRGLDYDWTKTYDYENCQATVTHNKTGETFTISVHPETVKIVSEAKCGQMYVIDISCKHCHNLISQETFVKEHNYVYNSEKDTYICSECNLENKKGIDGRVVLGFENGMGDEKKIYYYDKGAGTYRDPDGNYFESQAYHYSSVYLLAIDETGTAHKLDVFIENMPAYRDEYTGLVCGDYIYSQSEVDMFIQNNGLNPETCSIAFVSCLQLDGMVYEYTYYISGSLA